MQKYAPTHQDTHKEIYLFNTHTHTHIYIYIYICVCVCVYVCVCVCVCKPNDEEVYKEPTIKSAKFISYIRLGYQHNRFFTLQIVFVKSLCYQQDEI